MKLPRTKIAVKLRKWTIVIQLLAGFFGAGAGSAAVTFTWDYQDPAGVGFNAPGALGADRRAALELAGQEFAVAFSPWNADIHMKVQGNLTGSGALMGAGSYTEWGTGFGAGEVVRNKVLSNGAIDLSGAFYDGGINVNFSQSWELDINGGVSSSEYDWYSTVYHELGHAFGFNTGIFTDSSGGNSGSYFGTPEVWNEFDQFLTDKDGNSVFTGTTLSNTMYEGLLVGDGSVGGGLYFNSPDYGGLIELYSPSTYSPGSSGVHLDDENPLYAFALMRSATAGGADARTFSDVELSIFRDIGYTQIGQIPGAPVPEPTAVFLIALAAFGFGSRRRRSRD